MKRRGLFASSCVALGVCLGTHAALAAPDDTWTYEIARDGTPIGSHTISFSRTASQHEVRITTDITVRVVFVVYRYRHEGVEKWEDGVLVAWNTQTNDNGTQRVVAGRRVGNELRIETGGEASTVDGGLVPDSLWNEGRIRDVVLLDSEYGRISRVNVESTGRETVVARGATVPARHYRVTGDLECEAWYADDGALARLRFRGWDGSNVDYILK